jgi:hypothetical protein
VVERLWRGPDQRVLTLAGHAVGAHAAAHRANYALKAEPVSQTRLTASHDEREAHDGHEENFSRITFANVVNVEILVMVRDALEKRANERQRVSHANGARRRSGARESV